MDEDVKAKLTAAWPAPLARLIETGYAPKDVYDTMISVGLSARKIELTTTLGPLAGR
jgi:hypothetical protein